MELSTGFLIYAAVFRLAVIAVGIVAIVLGYFLFVRVSSSRSRTEAGLEIAEFKLNLKNAAPGTCFAAFGAGIILAMLIEGSPSLTMETAQNVAAAERSAAPQPVSVAGSVRSLTMKGDPEGTLPPGLADRLESAASSAAQGDLSGAMNAYSAILEERGLLASEAALALQPMAEIALQRGDHAQAETFARLAMFFAGYEAGSLDTLARVLIAQGHPGEAVELARQARTAAPNEPRYLHTLAIALVQTGARQEAVEVLDQAVRLDGVYAAERTRLLGAGQ